MLMKICTPTPIPYTLPLRSYRHLGKEYSITFFKEAFGKKKIKENWVKELRFYQSSSYITQNIIVHFIILVYPVDEAIFKNDGALAIKVHIICSYNDTM